MIHKANDSRIDLTRESSTRIQKKRNIPFGKVVQTTIK